MDCKWNAKKRLLSLPRLLELGKRLTGEESGAVRRRSRSFLWKRTSRPSIQIGVVLPLNMQVRYSAAQRPPIRTFDITHSAAGSGTSCGCIATIPTKQNYLVTIGVCALSPAFYRQTNNPQWKSKHLKQGKVLPRRERAPHMACGSE